MGFQQESCYCFSKQCPQTSNRQQNMHKKITSSPVVNCKCKAQERILCHSQNVKTAYTQQMFIPDQQKPSRFNCHGRSFEFNRDFNSKERLKITIENPSFNRGYPQKNVAPKLVINRGQGESNKCNNCEKNLYKGQSNGQNKIRKSSQDLKWHTEGSNFQQIALHGVENTATIKNNALKHALCRSKSFVDNCSQQKLLSSENKKSSITDKIDREDNFITASFKKDDNNNKPLTISEAISLHMKDNLNKKEKPIATNHGSILEKNALCAKSLERNKRPLKISEAIAQNIQDNFKEKSSLMKPVEWLASEMGDCSKKSFFIDNEYCSSSDDIVQQFHELKIPPKSSRDCKESNLSLNSKNYKKESISKESTDMIMHKKDMEKFNVSSNISETSEFQTKNEVGQNIMLIKKNSAPNGDYNDRQKLHRSKSSIDFYHQNANSQRSSISTNIPDFNKIYSPQKNLKNSEVTISPLKHSNLKERKDYHCIEVDLKLKGNSFCNILSNPREVNRCDGKYSAQERLLALKSKSSDRNKFTTPSTSTENTTLIEKLNFNSNTQKSQLISIASKQIIEAPKISSRIQQRLLLHTFQN